MVPRHIVNTHLRNKSSVLSITKLALNIDAQTRERSDWFDLSAFGLGTE